MKDHSPISIPWAIILGSILISVSILISGGIIKLKLNSQGSNPTSLNQQPQEQTPPAPNKIEGVTKVQGVTAGNLPTLGSKDAKVTIVEFADFQCPFCGRFFSETEPQIKKDYLDSGKAKLSFRDFAFLGPESNDAALAARCANEQGKFWQYHDYLYSHQGGENQGVFSKDNLKKFASDLGLNTGQFNDCIDANKYLKDVNDDIAVARKLGVNSTPTVFINGAEVVGAQPYANFKSVIDQALAQ